MAGGDRVRVLLLVATALLGACAPARAPSSEDPMPLPAIEWAPRVYVCHRAAGPMRVDGRLDEADWAAAPFTEEFVDIEGPGKPTPVFSTRAKLLWSEAGLHVAAVLEEPDVRGTLTRRDSVVYHDNDFEVFLDPDGDTHLYYELEINALGTEWDLLLVRPYRDGGPAVNAWDIKGLETAVRVDGTLNRPGDVDRGWTVEMLLPWESLAECAGRPVPPRPGDRWRLNFSRVQWQAEAVDGRYVKRKDPATGEPLPESNWVWSPQGLVAMHYPEMWGILLFSEQPAGAGEEAFVPDPADGARWLLRQVYYAERLHRAATGSFTNDPGDLDLAAADLAASLAAGLEIRATGDRFDARLRSPDGRDLTIDEEGRVR